jgi:phosphoenolpyruvate carboxykinase (GTP)
MLPFCGYNMGDYFQHWLDMEKKISRPPKIFNVNWFRTDDNGNFMWPGFGENMRVLKWILDRADGTAGARETFIGYVPRPEDINLEGIEDECPPEVLKELLDVDAELWKKEAESIKEFYAMIGDSLPQALQRQLDTLIANLEK